LKRLFPLFLAAMLCGGCLDFGSEKKEEVQPVVSGSVDLISPEEPAISIDDSVKPTLVQTFDTEKWNTYVDLNNDLAVNFYPVLNNYFQAFGNRLEYDPPKSPADIQRFVEALEASGQLNRDIEKALAAAEGSQSSLDTATAEMAGNLKKLWDSLEKSRDYHLAPNVPEEVREAAGAAAHTDIYETYLAFEASYTRFMTVLNEQDSARRRMDLAEMRSKGLVVRPAMLRIIDDAQTIQDTLNRLGISSDNLSALDMAEYKPLYDKFLKGIDEYVETLESKSQIRKENLDSSRISTFTARVRTVRESAENLIKRHRDGAVPSEEPELHSGTPENFSQELGQLVELYNWTIH